MKSSSQTPPAEPVLAQHKPVVVALGLAGILLAIVLFINFLGAPRVAITVEVLEQLMERQLVDGAFIDHQGQLQVQLKDLQVIDDQQQSVRTDRVYLGATDWQPEQLDQWVDRGQMVLRPTAQSAWDTQAWPGILFIAVILGGGGYYLWRQAQWNKMHGSPRQHIEALAKQLEQGAITQEEYQEKLNAITPHL